MFRNFIISLYQPILHEKDGPSYSTADRSDLYTILKSDFYTILKLRAYQSHDYTERRQEKERFQNFKKTYSLIEETNQNQKDFQADINDFADYSDTEWEVKLFGN